MTLNESLFDKVINLGQDTMTTYSESVPTRSAAALAFRGIFSLAPLLFISIVVMSVFVGQETAQQEITYIVSNIFDEQSAAMVRELLAAETAQHTSRYTTIASLIGLVFLLYAASALFRELKIALNAVWGLPATPKKKVLAFVFTQLTAIAMVLLVGFFFLALIVINVTMSLLDTYIFQGEIILLRWGSLLGSLVATTLLVAVMYRLVPDVAVPWSDLWVGAAVTTILITVGIWGIGIYMSISNVGSALGAAGAIIILLLWLYYIGLVFLFGASFARAYAKNFGSQKPPPVVEQSDKGTG
jgi:membrane protein